MHRCGELDIGLHIDEQLGLQNEGPMKPALFAEVQVQAMMQSAIA
jgi:hypothetical protein